MNTKFTDDFPFCFCMMSNLSDAKRRGPRVPPVGIYYRTYTTHLFLGQVFKLNEATICQAIRRIAPLAERILKIKPNPVLSENDLQLIIVDATEQRIEQPKNQRDYYSGKAHAHTIKTEVVIEIKGRILRVSKFKNGQRPFIWSRLCLAFCKKFPPNHLQKFLLIVQ